MSVASSKKLSVSNKSEQFSVVIAVYKNDNSEWFQQAIDSILNQTTKSNDIVVVRDGIVPSDLEKILEDYEMKYAEISVLRLDDSVGAGQARNEGMKTVKNELVAIMDADDISLPKRFELQLAEFIHSPELVLVGGQMSEFESTPDKIVGYRNVPTKYDAIKKFARYRSPINHVTIMLKKSPFLAVGGYLRMNRAEDYYMVSALLAKSYRISNLQSTIVSSRINSESMRRRKTWKNVRENIISRWHIHKLGTVSFMDFCISSMAQLMLFLVPVGLVHFFFSNLLRSKNG